MHVSIAENGVKLTKESFYFNSTTHVYHIEVQSILDCTGKWNPQSYVGIHHWHMGQGCIRLQMKAFMRRVKNDFIMMQVSNQTSHLYYTILHGIYKAL